MYKFSRISRILAKFAKLNTREKFFKSGFAKINTREKKLKVSNFTRKFTHILNWVLEKKKTYSKVINHLFLTTLLIDYNNSVFFFFSGFLNISRMSLEGTSFGCRCNVGRRRLDRSSGSSSPFNGFAKINTYTRNFFKTTIRENKYTRNIFFFRFAKINTREN